MASVGSVAIVHFTASPAVGGIESMIDAQAAALREAGVDVRLVIGAPANDLEAIVLPLLHPNHSRIVSDLESRDGASPTGDSLVEQIANELAHAIAECDAVFVHNVLTTVLNPPAREAVCRLALEAGGPRWVVWCEDVSAMSAYVDGRDEPDLLELHRAGVRFVTISEARRRDLYTVYGFPASDVEVVEPPVDSGLLGLDGAALGTARALGMLDSFPVVLVPAKLAAHKRLDRAVELAAWLDQTCARSLVLVTGTPSVHQPEMSANVADALSVQSHGVAGFVVLSTRGVSLEAAGLRTLMLLSDVVYLPSDEEGYGLPAAEAAALGVPVVCSDIPAFRESGAGWARYVSPDAGAEEVALLVLEVASAPAAQARRRAVRSSERFRAATLRLAGYPNV